MSPRDDDLLRRALETAAGRTGARAAGTTPDTYTWVANLVAARRRLLEGEGCPAAVRRRAEALFRERAEPAAAALLRLVFDSWRDLAPALRGPRTPRVLRFAGRSAAVDLLLRPDPEGSTTLLVAVEPARPGLRVRAEVPGRRPGRLVALDARGSGRLRLPRGARAVCLVVCDARREVLRTPQASVERGG